MYSGGQRPLPAMAQQRRQPDSAVALCDTPVGSFMAFVMASFVQLLMVITTCFLTQWSTCDAAWVGIGIEWGLDKVDINGATLEYTEHKNVFANLSYAADAVFWMSILALLMGFTAVGLAGFATFKHENWLWPFAMMAMAGDVLLRSTSVLLYMSVMMPQIKRVDFKGVQQALDNVYGRERKWFNVFDKFKAWRANSSRCSRQRIALGVRGTVIEVCFIALILCILFFCGYPCNKTKQEQDDSDEREAREIQMRQLTNEQSAGQAPAQAGLWQNSFPTAPVVRPMQLALAPPVLIQDVLIQNPQMGQQTDLGVGPLPVQPNYGQQPGGDFGLGSQQHGYGY